MELTSDKLVVVIRSAGERTLNACIELVLREIDPSLLHVVELVPFEEALRASYKIGIQSGAKWMMTLDADVLLRTNAIHDFVAEAELLPDTYFHLEGLIFDKLTGLHRKAGHRIYRVSKLEEALELVPADGEQIRPEFTTICRMQERGYLAKESTTVFGIHDFEQYYEDVYRKCKVHAQKHVEWIPKLITRWKSFSTEDADFLVALRAVYDGMLESSEVKIDKRLYQKNSLKALNDLNLKEKGELKLDFDLASMIDSTLLENAPAPITTRRDATTSNKNVRIVFLKRKIRELGVFKTLIYLIGLLFSKIGKKFMGVKSKE